MTIREIMNQVTEAGSHFFDKDTMRFFRSRVSETVHEGKGGVFFVTSEQFVNGEYSKPRRYTVRQFHPSVSEFYKMLSECCPENISPFQYFATSKSAHAYAAKLAKGS